MVRSTSTAPFLGSGGELSPAIHAFSFGALFPIVFNPFPLLLETKALVDYQHLPYSHLIGVETPVNRSCDNSKGRWYINGSVSEVAGGWLRDLNLYLDEIRPLLLKHHQDPEVHPNLNCKAVTIQDQVRIGEEPPPLGTLWLGNQVLLPDDFLGPL